VDTKSTKESLIGKKRDADCSLVYGRLFPVDFDAHDPEHRMIEPETIKGQTPFGELHRLAPQVKLSKTPGRWRTPLLVVRGSDRPVWES